jgi:hypothetical protein
VVEEGSFGECGSFDSDCDETGVQTRQNIVCLGGQEVSEPQTQSCRRETDGDIVDSGEFSECEGFDNVCDETGQQTRQEFFCLDGQVIERTGSQDCSRDTDGNVIDESEPGPCGGFNGRCGQEGVATVVQSVCSNGEVTSSPITVSCERNTEGIVIEEGEPGECGNFDDDCDETGLAPRDDTVCRGGQAVTQQDFSECTRETDGNQVVTGEFGECTDFDSVCDETGVRNRVIIICRDGEQEPFQESEDCSRDTDGDIVVEGQFGICSDFETECDETGTQTRQVITCLRGQESIETESQGCERDTDGVVVQFGEFGSCGGFTDECDETGLRSRTVLLCRRGLEESSIETQECSRSVEGCENGSVCGDADDRFEVNQEFNSAGSIGEGATEAFLCRQDFFNTLETDFYSFIVPDNATLDITVNFEEDLGGDFLALAVFDQPDPNAIRTFMLPDFNNLDFQTYVLENTIRINSNEGGEWFLEVNSTSEGVNLNYTIDITITPDEAGSCEEFVPDIFEANNSCANGTVLPVDLQGCTPGTGGCACTREQTCNAPLSCVQGSCMMAYVCGPEEDEDFYLINVQEGSELQIGVPHFHFNGNIDVEVFEPDFTTIAGISFNAGPNIEEVTINPTVSGTYCVRVFSQSRFTTNAYSIFFEER